MKKEPSSKGKGGAGRQAPDLWAQQAPWGGKFPPYPDFPPMSGFPAAGHAAALPQEKTPLPDVRPDEDTFVKAMRDIAVAAWKLKAIVFKPGTDEPAAALDAKQLADIGFYAERLNNILGTLGVSMQDFTGQPFHAGMPVKVIAAKPTPNLVEEIVFQTLTPTLKFDKTGEFYPGNVITLKAADAEEQPVPGAPAP